MRKADRLSVLAGENGYPGTAGFLSDTVLLTQPPFVGISGQARSCAVLGYVLSH